MAYEKTEVPVARSQEQIRILLRRAGADRATFGEGYEPPLMTAGVEFVHQGALIRMVIPLHAPSEAAVKKRAAASRTRNIERVREALIDQESRRVWRVMHWVIKSRMEAVDAGLETFEQAFLPHIVDPRTNRTVWDTMRPAIEAGEFQTQGGKGLAALKEAAS